MTDSPEALSEQERAGRALDIAHRILLVLTVALRPVIFGGDLTASDQHIWFGLVLVGLVLCWFERFAGLRRGWNWGWGGILGALAVLLMLPAAFTAVDPAQGLGRWAAWGGLLAWASYLMQVLPTRLLFGQALLAGSLAVQVVLVLVQKQWVLPGMAEALVTGQDGLMTVAARVGSGELGERIANGGAYGTLTLANTVAAWLLVVAAPLAGSAMLGVRAWRAEADTKPPVSKLALLCVLLAACAAAMVASGARGPAAALVVASALVATTWLQSWYRVLPLVAVAILAGVAAQLPQLADNISVRLGYWRAAVTLIGEAPLAGHGIAGFEHAAPALLRVGDEFSRFAHNLYLETAVAGGVFAGAAVLAMGGWLALRRPAQIRAEPELSTALDQWLVFIPALAFPYMLMFGTLASDNLAWWPGAPTMPPLWALLLGVMFGWIAQAARALPLAPAPAWQLAVGTAVLACALDFSAQDLGFAGTAVLVVCLAGARQPRCCQARFADLLAAALPVAAGVVLVLALGRGSQLRSIDRSVSLLDGFGQAAAKGDAEGVWGYVHDLALESGREAPTQDQLTQAVVQAVLLQAWAKADAACVAWPPSPIRRHQLAPRHPDPSARLGAVRAALDAMPERPDSWATLAQLMLMQRRFADAVTAAREAVRIYPAKLGYQLLLADALEAQARASSEPEPLTGEAAALRAEVKRLNPQAHARHRAP